MSPRVIELPDLPKCEPGTSDAAVLVLDHVAFVAYDIKLPRGHAALLRFDGLRTLVAPGPNDEAFHNHPWYRLGLRRYTIQEIVDSPLSEEVSRQHHKDGRPGASTGRHFVLALKETTVDVLANGVALVGVYESKAAAIRAALDVATVGRQR